MEVLRNSTLVFRHLLRSWERTHVQAHVHISIQFMVTTITTIRSVVLLRAHRSAMVSERMLLQTIAVTWLAVVTNAQVAVPGMSVPQKPDEDLLLKMNWLARDFAHLNSGADAEVDLSCSTSWCVNHTHTCTTPRCTFQSSSTAPVQVPKPIQSVIQASRAQPLCWGGSHRPNQIGALPKRASDLSLQTQPIL